MSLGRAPHVREKKYTPLNTEHMGEGRDTEGGRGRHPKRWMGRAPSQP